MTPAVRYFAEHGGWRIGVVYAEGRRYVSLLDVALLRDVKIAASDSAHLQEIDIPPARLARRIDQRRRVFRRHGIGHAAKLAKRVAARLRAP